MKKILVFLCAMLLVFAITGMAKAEVILYEDFEDSSGFTISGGSAAHWGIAPLTGTNFTQGGSQDGNIFFGSFAKDYFDDSYDLSLQSLMTISIPDLTDYTNLELTVAIASVEGVFETTHRDSLHIINGTSGGDCSAGPGCMPVTGAIDNFLPIVYGDDLWSNVHSRDLGLQFQDFVYTIDSSLESLTFAFSSTDYPEVVGIDSVKITGDPLSELPVALDIKPGSCPNPLNIDPKGILTVAILGTADLDVTTIDLASVRLEEVAPIRSSVNDVATPVVNPQSCECNSEGEDGFDDLILKFKASDVIEAVGDVSVGDIIELTLSGVLNDGTPIEGVDCIVFVKKGGKKD